MEARWNKEQEINMKSKVKTREQEQQNIKKGEMSESKKIVKNNANVQRNRGKSSITR